MEPLLHFRRTQRTVGALAECSSPTNACPCTEHLSGDAVSQAAADQSVRRFSRLISRRLRMSVGFGANARFLGLLSALAIFVGVQTSAPFERVDSPSTELVTSLSAPMPALHSVPTSRVAFTSRAPSRLTDGLGVALPADRLREVATTTVSRHALAAVIARPSGSVVSRGYDATAPPALS